LSANAPTPGHGQLRAIGQDRLLRAVARVEAVLRLTLGAGAALPAHRPPVQDDEVGDRHVGDALAHRGHHARGLVAEQNGNLSVMPPSQ
jgi:hypothetical protein